MSVKNVIFGRYKMIKKPLRIHAKSLSDALAPSKSKLPAALASGSSARLLHNWGTHCWSDFCQKGWLAPRCFRARLHNLPPASDRSFIFASHFATRMVLAIAIISRLLCLQRTRGSFKYFPKNSLLSFCRNMKSALHVPYAGWLILSLCLSSHTWFQECFVINPSVLLQDLHHALVRCLISLHVCAVFHVITFAPSFISSP